MDGEDPLACWHLFSYTALLNESRYLSRTLRRLTAALYSSETHNSLETAATPEPFSLDSDGLKALDFSLKQLESDVTKALEIVKSTIDMVSMKSSIHVLILHRFIIIRITKKLRMPPIQIIIWNFLLY